MPSELLSVTSELSFGDELIGVEIVPPPPPMVAEEPGNLLPPLPPPGALIPPRVGIALLTLQLRASLHEAAAAEAAGSGAVPDEALAELRARLEPLIEAHRRSLDEALAQARLDAAAAVAAAHREASVIVSAAAPHSTGLVVAREMKPADVVTIVPTVRQQADIELSTPFLPALPPINIVIDAEAFARVFSTVLATVLDERRAEWPAELPVARVAGPAPVAEPHSPKRSFWTHALHPDVLLLGLAMVVVLVVLVAWLA